MSSRCSSWRTSRCATSWRRRETATQTDIGSRDVVFVGAELGDEPSGDVAGQLQLLASQAALAAVSMACRRFGIGDLGAGGDSSAAGCTAPVPPVPSSPASTCSSAGSNAGHGGAVSYPRDGAASTAGGEATVGDRDTDVQSGGLPPQPALAAVPAARELESVLEQCVQVLPAGDGGGAAAGFAFGAAVDTDGADGADEEPQHLALDFSFDEQRGLAEFDALDVVTPLAVRQELAMDVLDNLVLRMHVASLHMKPTSDEQFESRARMRKAVADATKWANENHTAEKQRLEEKWQEMNELARACLRPFDLVFALGPTAAVTQSVGVGTDTKSPATDEDGYIGELEFAAAAGCTAGEAGAGCTATLVSANDGMLVMDFEAAAAENEVTSVRESGSKSKLSKNQRRALRKRRSSGGEASTAAATDARVQMRALPPPPSSSWSGGGKGACDGPEFSLMQLMTKQGAPGVVGHEKLLAVEEKLSSLSFDTEEARAAIGGISIAAELAAIPETVVIGLTRRLAQRRWRVRLREHVSWLATRAVREFGADRSQLSEKIDALVSAAALRPLVELLGMKVHEKDSRRAMVGWFTTAALAAAEDESEDNEYGDYGHRLRDNASDWRDADPG